MPKSNTLQLFCMYLKKYCIAEADTENFLYCFRGHKSKAFEYKPSLLRNKGYIENEEKIKNEVIAHYPELFHEPGNITIEDLAIMQHYGIPTRLLDVTFNPFVVMFFLQQKKLKRKKKLIWQEKLLFSKFRKNVSSIVIQKKIRNVVFLI